jgi:hypothetical protein
MSTPPTLRKALSRSYRIMPASQSHNHHKARRMLSEAQHIRVSASFRSQMEECRVQSDVKLHLPVRAKCLPKHSG